MKIAVGVAEGLLYLHQELKVINRDIKAGNILLDADFVPKLSDFGLATKISFNGSLEIHKQARALKVNKQCAAPESEFCGLVSTKTDVYGYGILILELFTGSEAYDSQRPVGNGKITDWVRFLQFISFNTCDTKTEHRNINFAVDIQIRNKRHWFTGGRCCTAQKLLPRRVEKSDLHCLKVSCT